MANSTGQPDFVIGIDFGQTYTGVVWTNLGETERTRPINDWPGLPPDSNETKVPTRIAYPAGHENHERCKCEPLWGFLCDSDDEPADIGEVHEHFKIYLDQGSLDAAKKNGVRNMPETVDKAQELVTDYLRQIYLHTKFSLESATGSWENKQIEFVFSLPTTWESQDTINRFKNAIDRAGFTTRKTTKHTFKLELTEAEAAAVFMASEPQIKLTKGDIILICDAGGGTTDLGLIEIADADPSRPSLKQVNAVKGIGIGSTMIDRAFQRLVQERLNNQEHSLHDHLAYKLARSSAFQSVKHNFGSKMVFEVYKLPLHKLDLDIDKKYTNQALGIEGGTIQFPRAQIQALFDTQVRNILKQIKKQLDWMATHKNGTQVKLLVLSGGLGGSQYVQTKIQEHFKNNLHPSAKNLSVIKSREPRLVVVKGLVMDRRQQLLLGGAALKTRIARASYGVLCRQLYDPEKYPWHNGATVVIDPLSKKRFATGQVDWIIKKGDTVDTDTAKERDFTRKVIPGDPNRSWDTSIVVSHEERNRLPDSFKPPLVLKLCQITSDMKEIREEEFKLKNRKLWQGKKYYDATFTVKVIIAPADLKFELWFGGKKYNRSHDPISVEYDAVGAAAKPRVSVDEVEADADVWQANIDPPVNKTRWNGLPRWGKA